MKLLPIIAAWSIVVAAFAIGPIANASSTKMECFAPAGGKFIKRNGNGIVWTTEHETTKGSFHNFPRPFTRWWGCSYSYGRTLRLRGFRSGYGGNKAAVRRIGRWYVTLAHVGTHPDCSLALSKHRFHASLITGNVKWLRRPNARQTGARTSCTG